MAPRINPNAIRGTRGYVPAMAMSGELALQPAPFSLGAPAAASDTAITTTGINAQAAATTKVDFDWTSDAYYGRTLQLKVSGDPGAASSVIDVFGEDYLGQKMVERFTTPNGSSAIQYGKKAFMRVTHTKIVTASTNAVTARLGTAFRVGLPFKGDLAWAKENGLFVPLFNRRQIIWHSFDAAAAVAGGSAFKYVEFPGYIESIIGIPHGGGSTNDPVVTIELATAAVTGLTVTVDVSNAAGAQVTDTPTTAGYNANNRFRPGDSIEIVSAAAASAGAFDVGIVTIPTQQLAGDVTDPGTTTTGDPRGTYESLMTMDGVKEIIVGLMADNWVNASGNGGLHGIRHVVA